MWFILIMQSQECSFFKYVEAYSLIEVEFRVSNSISKTGERLKNKLKN